MQNKAKKNQPSISGETNKPRIQLKKQDQVSYYNTKVTTPRAVLCVHVNEPVV